jgi:hypothetical protein
LTKRLAAEGAEKDRYVKLYAQGHLDDSELETYLLDLKNQIGNLRLLIESVEADFSRKQENRLTARSTEAWLLTLRERLGEVDGRHRRSEALAGELAQLLVGRIGVGRDENGAA